jgi:23S rRNA pseudouridine2605 synthase
MLERLQKIISRAGIASRRHAEDLIRSGQVRVNGQVVTTLGAKADAASDRIEAAGKLVQISGERAYLVLHKPPQVVTSLADPEGRRSLRHLLVGVSERVYPVGRLDYAASGVVFLTSDGELARRIFEASYYLPQTYWVKVKGRLTEEQVRNLTRAVRGKVRLLRSPRAAKKNAANPWYEVELSGARRDLLRRNLRSMEHPVEKLKRVKLASLDLDGVAEGRYRRLEPQEVAKLAREVERALEKGIPRRSSPEQSAPHRRAAQPG